MEYLRPKDISIKLGVSKKFAGDLIGMSKCREIKKENEKTLFCYEDIIDFIKKSR